MAEFFNSATLTYNGLTTTSNIVTGELTSVLTATKTAVVDSYTAGESVTYVVSLVNSGATALTGLTVTDNLGGFTFGTPPATLYPLTYTAGSLQYYVNGALQTAPTVAPGPPLAITGVTVPAGGNATLIYQATANQFAPLAAGSQIVNTVSATGASLADAVTATETVTALAAPALTISKALSPTVVAENGQLTYTFTIQNTGNTAADAGDALVLTDTFDPILNPISVTYTGPDGTATAWTEGTQYTYNTTTGLFQTAAGQLGVAAATYTQDATTGAFTVTPGVSTLTVTGTV